MKRWVLIVATIAICYTVILAFQWQNTIFINLNEKIDLIKRYISNAGMWAPLIYLLGYTLRPVVLFPAVPFAILGGILFGSTWGAIYVLIGTMCSSACEFVLVRYFLGEKAKEYIKSKTKPMNQFVAKHGFLTVFLVRIVPNVAFDIQNCGLALTQINFKEYFYGTLLGCLPACIFYTSLGNLAFNRSVSWKIGFVISIGVCLYLLRIFIITKNKK